MTSQPSAAVNALAAYPSIAGPRQWQSEDARLEAALSYAVQVAGRWTKNGEVFIPAIEPGMLDLDGAIAPIWQRRGYASDAKEEFSHYHFPDWEWPRWQAFLNASRRHRDLIFERIGFNIMKGAPVPDGLRIIAGAHVMGMTEPLPASKGKPKMRHRDTLIVGIAKGYRPILGIRSG